MKKQVLLTLSALAIAVSTAYAAPVNKIKYSVPGLVVTGAPTTPGGSGEPGGNPQPEQPPAPASLALSTSSLAFSTTTVGDPSASQLLRLTNSGGTALTVSKVELEAGQSDYLLSNGCTSLAAHTSCDIGVTFRPAGAGTRTGLLAITHTAGAKATVTLNGSAVTAGVLSLTPSELRFGLVAVGQSSATQQVTVSNSGGTSILTSGIDIALGANVFGQRNTCGEALAPGASCAIDVKFTPVAAVASEGALAAITSDGQQGLVSLFGSGGVPSAQLSAPTYTAVAVGTSDTRNAVLSNTGTVPLALTTPSAASVTNGPFSFSSTTCAGTLGAGESCNVAITFTPVAKGAAQSATLSLSTELGARTATLSATGLQGVAGLATPTAFGNQAVGAPSAVKQVVLSNTGDAPLVVSKVEFESGATDFTQTNQCTSIAAGGNCTIDVTFTPSVLGNRTGTLAVTHNGTTGKSTVNVSGTGAAATGALTAAVSNAFGPIGVNTTGSRSFTFQNSGVVAATGVYAALSGSSEIALASNNCGTSAAPVTVAAGASCTFTVNYTPTTTSSSLSGSVKVTSSATNSPNTLALTGSGIARTQVWTASSGTFVVPINVSSMQVLVVAGGGGGGAQAGGGGGAGGVIYNASYAVTAGASLSWQVGAGGAGAATNSVAGGSGGSSVFGSITAVGGGGGASSGTYPVAGGSGGGAGYWFPSSAKCSNNPGANGTAGQGNKGGNGTNGPTYSVGGGGGGAASVGGNYTNCDNGPGVGGTGSTYSLGGTSYTVGGGGGGGTLSPGASGAAGGSSIGGHGGRSNLAAAAAVANTGSGGGGGGFGTGLAGANGSSGIVVVSW